MCAGTGILRTKLGGTPRGKKSLRQLEAHLEEQPMPWSIEMQQTINAVILGGVVLAIVVGMLLKGSRG
jgi:hypothetical protein